MRSPSPQSLHRNGDAAATPSASPQTRNPFYPATATPSPLHHHHHHHFHSTVAVQKLRRFNSLILVFRVVTFIFSLSSAIFMATNYRGSDSVHWYDFDAFRFVLAAGGIVALYSLFEMVASVWEITRGITIFPEILQVWFDFSHDQVFAYMLISAESAGTALAKTLKKTDTCSGTSAFCLQSDISLALGFIGFLFLGFSSLLSGFRLASFIINGSRFHL